MGAYESLTTLEHFFIHCNIHTLQPAQEGPYNQWHNQHTQVKTPLAKAPQAVVPQETATHAVAPSPVGPDNQPNSASGLSQNDTNKHNSALGLSQIDSGSEETLGLGAAAIGGPVTFPFTLEQITGFQDFMTCREDKIESCTKINLDFDMFDSSDRLSILNTTLEKRFEKEVGNDIKFFEVIKLYPIYPIVCRHPWLHERFIDIVR